jgi:hypothetical protein
MVIKLPEGEQFARKVGSALKFKVFSLQRDSAVVASC